MSNKLNWIKIILPYNYILTRRFNNLCNIEFKEDYCLRLSKSSFDLHVFKQDYNLCKQDVSQILNDANNILYSKIEILGLAMDVSGAINWHTDVRSNYCWKKGVFYKKIKTIQFETNSDIKNVWELSRCHHLLWLGEAYLITKNEKFVIRLIDTIDDWINENPYNYSVNWTCSMEVAIRAVNWIYAVNMVSESKYVTVNFLNKLFFSLYQHGNFIYTNLEDDFPFSANHYASNIAGLLYISYLFTDYKFGKKWSVFALNAFLYEVRTQILPSGFHYERSVSYHRLMTELFLYSYLKVKQNNPEHLAIDITFRIKSMINVIDCYTKPNGLAPMIGDNDDGRFLPFVKRNHRDHRYLISIASNVFSQKYCNSIPEVIIDSLIVAENNKSSRNHFLAHNCIQLFDDAGYCILRNKSYHLSFINTGISKYKQTKHLKVIGTHTHQDSLSVEISKNNSDFIVDPGSYTYTSSIVDRNHFRSTIRHNTLSIDGMSQYDLSDFFTIEPKNSNYQEPKEIKCNIHNNTIFVESSFDWHFCNPQELITHYRIIEFSDVIIIKDTVNSYSKHHYEWNFNLDLGIVPQREGTCIKLTSPNGDTMHFQIDCEINYKLSLIDDFISPSYGILNPSKRINICIENNNPFTIYFNFK